MKKIIKWFLIIVIILGIGLFGAYKYMISQTKKASPEDTVVYNQEDLNLSVFYNRPSKKGRVIFGDLVPYGKVWRTGANEATTFETNKDISINGKKLPAGKYSLFTIPGKNSWEIIFNSKSYSWGVKGRNEASLEREFDALVTNVSVSEISEVEELFTISFENTPDLALLLSWDQTKIVIPIQQ
ncbi:DUF2911 domain-containing protein [Flavobacteriaceae bacterium AU392]|nr:DUF2911 domain-containing protein [Flavobacteriaceae bacterium]RKM85617.1 DUF2911 domain-containing protein [Flavobacteriaceae bacterium AU392]